MSVAAAYIGAGFAVLNRDFRIYITYRARFFGELVTVAFTVVAFYFVSRLVKTPQFRTPDEYFAFVVVGLVVFRTLVSVFGNTSNTLRQEMVAGTYERMVASPFGTAASTVSLALFPLALSLVLGLATLVFGALAFGVPLAWSTVPLAIPATVLALLSFAPFIVLIETLVILFKQATAGAGLVIAGLSLVSGIAFPVTLLPGWIEWVSEVQPFTPAVDLMRHLIVGQELADPILVVMGKLVGFTVVLLPISILVLNAAIDFTRRRATLIEY